MTWLYVLSFRVSQCRYYKSLNIEFHLLSQFIFSFVSPEIKYVILKKINWFMICTFHLYVFVYLEIHRTTGKDEL
jgi:hypothetical protein